MGPVHVSFRFYGSLNDFLPSWHQGTRCLHRVPSHATVKDAVEAIGVPHPEIDLIIINGAPATFGARVQEGDTIAVYPLFRSIPIGDARVGVDPPRPARFALDIHLQKLASWLRLAGFDSIVVADDGNLAEAGARSVRIVLTRDVALLKRTIVRLGYWVRETDPDLQLAEVVERFDLAPDMTPFARCLKCNALVIPVDPDMVAGIVPLRTQECVSKYHWCPGCDRVYWRGAHYERLVGLVERARQHRASTIH